MKKCKINDITIDKFFLVISSSVILFLLFSRIPNLIHFTLEYSNDAPQVLGRYSIKYFFFLVVYSITVMLFTAGTIYLFVTSINKKLDPIIDKVFKIWQTLLLVGIGIGGLIYFVTTRIFEFDDFITTTIGDFRIEFIVLITILILAFKPSKKLTNLLSQEKRNIIDILVILLFITFALMLFFGYYGNISPYPFLAGDAAFISGMTLARTYPDLFVNDPLLGNPENFQWYQSILIPIIQWYGEMTGDFSSMFVYLIFPLVIIQGFGFYLLGWKLFNNRYWSILFALISSFTTFIFKGFDMWGIWYSITPRHIFQIFHPYLLILAITWRTQPKRWPLLMIFAGLLAYTHSVSAPSWGFAIWIGLWACKPSDWKPKKHIGYMFLLGFVYICTIAPFGLNYIGNRSHETISNYPAVLEVMELCYGQQYLDQLELVKNIPINLLKDFPLITILGTISIIFISIEIFKKRTKSEIPALILTWLLGVLFVSVLVPLGEYGIARLQNTIPLLTDLYRGLRFLPLFLLIFSLLGFWKLNNILDQADGKTSTRLSKLVPRLALLFILFIITNYSIIRPQFIECWVKGEANCPLTAAQNDWVDILSSIRETTHTRSSVLPITNDWIAIHIRYYTLRSVKYSFRDCGGAGYSNSTDLMEWYAIYQEVSNIQGIDDNTEKLSTAMALAKGLDADYLLIDWRIAPASFIGLDGEIIYINNRYTLIEINY